jgi:hypothetical protein
MAGLIHVPVENMEEQDLSIGTIFRLKKYLYVPLILSTGPNGM